ncbi:M48 family metallopeptidase [Ottowia sp. GY511]|uniref:M48 family metallopeptidase n=1 Tax=Ottowia flava TaxID=2675430 RepID=A0ABW4KW34_9BURK|nr:M48 family metallopeptidase [Ottowia sp. GY511]TXK31192.1 M48 family metallopeptidase [Ottowia sp. GY511]
MNASATPADPPRVLSAQWFDGRSSRARPVQIALRPDPAGARLLLKALDGDRERLELAPGEVGWPERWSAGHAPPRVAVDLGPHGSLQVDDVAGWQAALAAARHRRSLAERMQTQWPVLLGVLVVAVVGVWAFYRWGTPWAAAQITRHVPVSWELALTDRAMKEIDEQYVKPTQLPKARQDALRAEFDQLVSAIDPVQRRYSDYRPRYTLEFRSGMPPNAFALPGGTIVMTDAMVKDAARIPGTGDAALLGVLAHEIGHVEHRHTTRMVVEQGVLNAGLGLALGDVSTLVQMGATALTGLAYQRGHEAESDCYAIALMARRGLPTAPMADLLQSLDQFSRGSDEDESDAPESAAPVASAAQAKASAPRRRASQVAPTSEARKGPSFDWLSTHPDTDGRAARLRAGTGC